MIIVNENTMYMFFETIKQLEPERILDVGMFLKRIGGISRRVKNYTIAEEIELDGIDIYPEIDFPVWKNVYDNVTVAEAFLAQDVVKKYDLTILLGMKEIEQKVDMRRLLSNIQSHTDFILMDKLPEDMSQELQSTSDIKIMRLENETYYLLSMEE